MNNREEIFLKEFDAKLEFSIIDGGSVRADYGDIIRLMQEYADQKNQEFQQRFNGLLKDRDKISNYNDELQLRNTELQSKINEFEKYQYDLRGEAQWFSDELDKSEEKVEKLQFRIDELENLMHISEEMAKDLTEQSEFIDGSFESLAKYYNFKQNLKK